MSTSTSHDAHRNTRDGADSYGAASYAGSPADRRRRGSRRSRRRLTVVTAALVVLAAFAVWLVAFSSAFGVRSVSVRGVHELTAAQVQRQAHVTHGTPLVRLNTAAVIRRVEQLPDVYSAQVGTSFPSSVVITVTERTPVGYVGAGGRFHLVDRTGAQYRAVAEAPANLPELVVATGAAARSTGRAVGTVAASLPRSFLRHVRSIQAIDPSAITLVLTKGRIVRWGDSARSADKARFLPIMLRDKQANQFDLTDPDRPYSN